MIDRLSRWLEGNLQPPLWAVEEVQRRIVLLLNHILMQEPAAMQRLLRHQGSVLRMQWRSFSIPFLVTPAGLLDLAQDDATPDLRITVVDESVGVLAQGALRGEKPPVRIDGDVQLAAEVNWLAENLRWDLEEDLARVIGDAPAHALGRVGRRVAEALSTFVRPRGGQRTGAQAVGDGETS